MRNIEFFITIICCLFIFYQDLKYRLIHVGIVILLAACLLLLNLNNLSLLFFWFSINVLFLVVLLITLKIYFSIRKGKIKLINRFIGLGDILLFLVFCLAYNLYNYTVFLLAGCTFSLLYWVVQNRALNKRIIRIPLGSFLAISHLLLQFVCMVNSYDPLAEPISKLLSL
jgi:hypothetical protein